MFLYSFLQFHSGKAPQPSPTRSPTILNPQSLCIPLLWDGLISLNLYDLNLELLRRTKDKTGAEEGILMEAKVHSSRILILTAVLSVI